jgi:hypothetical protein
MRMAFCYVKSLVRYTAMKDERSSGTLYTQACSLRFSQQPLKRYIADLSINNLRLHLAVGVQNSSRTKYEAYMISEIVSRYRCLNEIHRLSQAFLKSAIYCKWLSFLTSKFKQYNIIKGPFPSEDWCYYLTFKPDDEIMQIVWTYRPVTSVTEKNGLAIKGNDGHLTNLFIRRMDPFSASNAGWVSAVNLRPNNQFSRLRFPKLTEERC